MSPFILQVSCVTLVGPIYALTLISKPSVGPKTTDQALRAAPKQV